MEVGKRRHLRRAIAANLSALLVILVYTLALAYPTTEAVRLRNALLIDAGKEADFSWTPDRKPQDFLRERRAPLAEFVQRTWRNRLGYSGRLVGVSGVRRHTDTQCTGSRSDTV
jgi:hypothetical protein